MNNADQGLLGFDDRMLMKIDNGEDLTLEELARLVLNTYVVDEIYNVTGYTGYVKTIIRLHDRYFAIEWEKRRNQFDYVVQFYTQPYEVRKSSYEKTITVTYWYNK